MNWKRAARLGTVSGMLALSACMMPYDGMYEAPPAPVYSAVESPDEYRFIDRADSLWEAIGDAPPDNAFAFEDAEPWAWELADGHRVVVEETGDGMRSYYFAPGDEGPFLAVRPGMSFGFDGEAVAVVYGPDGGAMPREAGAAHLGEGVELFARGRLLLRAMLQKQWRAVDSQAWIDASPILWSSIQLWDDGWQRHPGWGRHRAQWRDAEWRRRIELERLRRRERADAFRRWREGGFQGPPPGHYHKPGAGRPDRPDRPGGATPGTGRPPRQPGQWHRPGGAGAGWPPRPEAGQQVPGAPRGPRRPSRFEPIDSSTVTPETPTTRPAPGNRPRRPGWGGRPRPGSGAATPDGSATPTPTPQTRPDRPRGPRPEGGRPGWGRPRPGGGTTSSDGSATPAPAPQAQPDRSRWTRPEGGRPAWRRPPSQDGGAARPASSPAPRRNWSADAPRPERSAPPPRPSYTPSAPTPRSAPAPAPRSAPPPTRAPESARGTRFSRGERVD